MKHLWKNDHTLLFITKPDAEKAMSRGHHYNNKEEKTPGLKSCRYSKITRPVTLAYTRGAIFLKQGTVSCSRSLQQRSVSVKRLYVCIESSRNVPMADMP